MTQNSATGMLGAKDMPTKKRAKRALETEAAQQITSFRDVLEAAGNRPGGSGERGKISYATAFANPMARLIAHALRQDFPDIKPDRSGRGIESPAQSMRGLKRLDVNFSTQTAGLGLGVSLKSVHTPDKNPKVRFHHNMKRNDEELRVEALGYHQRQPYAVLVAVVILPFEACEDGSSDRASSFGTWVEYVWPLGGRTDLSGEFDRFEAVFVALYDADSADLGFFHVSAPPPKRGRPTSLLSLDEFAQRLADLYKERNSLKFRWAD